MHISFSMTGFGAVVMAFCLLPPAAVSQQLTTTVILQNEVDMV